MKKIAFMTVFVLLVTFAYSEPATFNKEIETNLNKTDGFKRALIWLAKTVNANGTVIQFQDKDSGSILASAGIAPVGVMKSAVLRFTINIEVSDGLVVFQVSDMFTNAITAPANSEGYQVDKIGFDSMYGVKIEAFEQEFENYLVQ